MKLPLDNDHSWRNKSACNGVDTEIFYPPRDKSLYKTIADEAKSYCNGTDEIPECPVRRECLWEAVRTEEPHGIWGGLSHRERNALVRKWQREYKRSMTLKEYIFGFKERENE
jgi:WhiB family redox-sensing transcriptional regulator